jgi:hypothetical protein
MAFKCRTLKVKPALPIALHGIKTIDNIMNEPYSKLWSLYCKTKRVKKNRFDVILTVHRR